MVEDPKLDAHLLHFGINVAGMRKTEKSMAELDLDQNLSFDFSRIQVCHCFVVCSNLKRNRKKDKN